MHETFLPIVFFARAKISARMKVMTPSKSPSKTAAKSNDTTRGIRFTPDAHTLALLDVNGGPEFKPTLYGLVLNESYQGCGLVILKEERIRAGAKLRVQVGKLAPMQAEVRWHKEVDDQVVKVGLFYLE